MIRMYRKYLSKLKRVPTCRFYPTCSSYALQAIERFGALKGGFLALQAHPALSPFSPGGMDPVPENFHWFSEKKKG